ncbi:MAG: peptidase M16, partial [Deltaproteobacteria bacterium]|nr:peptidase M16 [Deltaproteobacteria bacterium]
FLNTLPVSEIDPVDWSPGQLQGFEGMTIPSQVNYVGKGANLYRSGYRFHGSAHVISRFLRNSWLWDRVRVQGGAYGAFCLFDRLSGTMTFVSYRDPNLLRTIDVFDQSARFLRDMELSDDELTKGVIGSIGDLDRRHMREEILGTTAADFKAFARVLETVNVDGLVKILGSQDAILESLAKKPGWLNVLKVL